MTSKSMVQQNHRRENQATVGEKENLTKKHGDWVISVGRSPSKNDVREVCGRRLVKDIIWF